MAIGCYINARSFGVTYVCACVPIYIYICLMERLESLETRKLPRVTFNDNNIKTRVYRFVNVV